MNSKKLITLVLALCMLAGVLGGCGGNSATEGMVVAPGTDGKITKEPLELSLHMLVWSEPYNYDDVTMFQEAFRKTNIKVVGSPLGTGTDVSSAFNIMMTSNQLPDIVHGTKDNITKYATQGAFVDIEPLIEKYAPNIKAFLEKNDWARKGSLASDGKLYYVPFVRYGVPSVGFYIRQDWLDKLGLEIPKTVDEYYNVLKAFKERDPNGNGQRDEVPYFYRDMGVDGLVQLFGARAQWYVNDNGQYVFGKMQPEYKTAMSELAKWYKEGLIDQEIYSRGKQAREQLLGNNVGGSTHDWFTSTASYNDNFQKTIPGFSFVAIAPPADVNGKVKEEYGRQLLPGYGWGISRDNKYPVETIKFLDFWYSEEGIRLFNYGVEGVDYNMVDGKPQYTDVVLKADGGSPNYLRKIGKNELGTLSLIESEIDTMNSYARDGFALYDSNNYCLEQLPPLTFTPEETRVISEKGTAITTFINEKQQTWLFGNESIEDGFDAYIETVKSMGYDEVQAAYQAAYERYLKQ